MGRRKRGWWTAALLASLGLAGEALSQELAPPPQPAPPAAVSPVCPLPAPPACAPFEDWNGPLLKGDPLLDQPGLPQPGWFGAAELDLLKPIVRNRLVQTVNITGAFTDTVHLPSASFDWLGAPRVELGYRLAEGGGEFLASYFGVNTTGTAVVAGFDPLGDGFLRSRLETNVLYLDYGNYRYLYDERWVLFWRVGGGLSHAYFDSQVTGAFAEQRTSNFYLGGGPHAGLDLRRRLNVPGLALFGRVEAAGNVGRLTQNFEETFAAGGAPFIGGATKVSVIQWVPNSRVMAGLAWSPPARPAWNFSAGYLFEGWWYLGEAQGSSATLTMNGVFLRAECRY